jgi:glucose-1-phosphate cytidylyltransferase
MKYYAHFGHKDFILCLGYRAEKIKEYFLRYDECVSNDFTLSRGGKSIDLKRTDIDDWNITFVDTGLSSNIGSRLRQVEPYLRGEEMFLANYSDGLTDYELPQMLDTFQASGKIGAFLCAPPSQTFHVVDLGQNDTVQNIRYIRDTNLLVNCGFFVFRKQIFDYLNPGDDLVGPPFERLIKLGQLTGFRCKRFWAMDTFREQQELTDMYERGEAPWVLWPNGRAAVETNGHRYPVPVPEANPNSSGSKEIASSHAIAKP